MWAHITEAEPCLCVRADGLRMKAISDNYNDNGFLYSWADDCDKPLFTAAPTSPWGHSCSLPWKRFTGPFPITAPTTRWGPVLALRTNTLRYWIPFVIELFTGDATGTVVRVTVNGASRDNEASFVGTLAYTDDKGKSGSLLLPDPGSKERKGAFIVHQPTENTTNKNAEITLRLNAFSDNLTTGKTLCTLSMKVLFTNSAHVHQSTTAATGAGSSPLALASVAVVPTTPLSILIVGASLMIALFLLTNLLGSKK